MARLLYGNSPADFTITPTGRLLPGSVLTVWTAVTGGTQVTDLQDYLGNATTVVTSDEYALVRFYGPDGENDTLWLDSGQGTRLLVRPAVITASIGDGSILDEDINAAADIDPSKVAGTALTRDLVTVDEALSNAMYAGGIGNVIENTPLRANHALSSHVEGRENTVLGWYGHGEGAHVIVDGKIAHAEGNANLASGNDSHAEGNLTSTGRRRYPLTGVLTTGSEDAGDGLGVLQYVSLPTAEGDQTSWFPNPLTDNIESRYGTGAQKDAKGNIYASGHTPAVWTGDVPTTPNDLQWALHPYAVVRGAQEDEMAFITIAKAVWTGTVTKVYYLGGKPFTSISVIYSSFSPGVLFGGTGGHSEGGHTSAVGFGSHAEGWWTRAWGKFGSHAEGMNTQALEQGAHAEGDGTTASQAASHAEGHLTVASAYGSHAEGDTTVASGQYSHAEGGYTLASANMAHAQGVSTQASGAYGSHAEGESTVASGTRAHAEGYMTTASGDFGSHAEGDHTTASGVASHAEGYTTTASGTGAHAQGDNTVASGQYSHAAGSHCQAAGNMSSASGSYAKAPRELQEAYSAGPRVTLGDNQISRWADSANCDANDWYALRVMTGLENNRTYLFETTVIGRQTAGTAGTVGDSFAYKFQGAVTVAAGAMTVLGTITRTLIGRSSGMSGDGLSTGARMSAHTDIYQGGLILRYDNIADATFYVSVHSTVQELG